MTGMSIERFCVELSRSSVGCDVTKSLGGACLLGHAAAHTLFFEASAPFSWMVMNRKPWHCLERFNSTVCA